MFLSIILLRSGLSSAETFAFLTGAISSLSKSSVEPSGSKSKTFLTSSSSFSAS